MNNDILTKVFKWFSLGLFLTFLTGFLVSNNLMALTIIFGSGITYIVLIILEFFIAIWLSTRIESMNFGLTKALYIGYTVLSGLTMSSIFILYDLMSIIWIFLASAIVFAIFAFLGKRGDIDLTGYGIYLAIALIAIIILEVINIFIMSSALDMGLCIFTLIVFVIYVAYDVQILVRRGIDNDNVAVIGAFELYLDFINIFINLLKLFGNRRD